MSLLINYPVTAAGVLALVTLLAYVGGNWRRDLYCPEYGFDGIDPGPYCYWSMVNALLVPSAITVSILGLGLVARALSVTLAFVPRRTRDLVKVYPWYCLLAAVVLFGPWDRRLGWMVADCLGRLALVLCAWIAAGTMLTLSYLDRIASTAWSRIQLETAVCERVRAKAIDSHVAFGLIWLPFFASETGNHWLGYLWRTTNPRARRGYSLPKSRLDVPAPIDYERLRAQLMEEAAGIATRDCERRSAAMLLELGGHEAVYSWTLKHEFARLEREHPEKDGLEQWKQEKERQAAIWDGIRAERKASQLVPGAYDTGHLRPNQPTRDRPTNGEDLRGGGIVGDISSLVLLNVLSLSSFLCFPSRLSFSSCPNRPTPGPVLAGPIDRSPPRISVAASSPHSSQSKQSRRRTGFDVSSSHSTTIVRSVIPPPTPRSQPTPIAVVATKVATRFPVSGTPPRATARPPTCRSNLPSGWTSERAVFNVSGVVHQDPKLTPLPTPTVTTTKLTSIPLTPHDEISEVRPGSQESAKSAEGLTVRHASPPSSPGVVSTEYALRHCELDVGSTQRPIATQACAPVGVIPQRAPENPAVVPRRTRRKAALARLEPPAYIPDGIFLELAYTPRPAVPPSMDAKYDLVSAFSAAGTLVSSIVPPFSRMAIEEDEEDVDMLLDAVDTPDVTMSSPDLGDVDMFEASTPPSPMMIDLPEVPEVTMDSPALAYPSEMEVVPDASPTSNDCEATTPVYTQPGAWEGFMVWHQELTRSTAVPAFYVPPIPQAWSQPAPVTAPHFGTDREDVGLAWIEASPETQAYPNTWAPEPETRHGPTYHNAWVGAPSELPSMAAMEAFEPEASVNGLTRAFVDMSVPESWVVAPTYSAYPEWTHATLDSAFIQPFQNTAHVNRSQMDIHELAQAFAHLSTPATGTGTSEVAIGHPTSTAESAAQGWTGEAIIEHPAGMEGESQDQPTVTSLSQAFAGMWVPDADSISASGSVDATAGNLSRPEAGTVPVSADDVEAGSVGQAAMDDLVNSLKCMRTSRLDYTQSLVSKATRVAVITEVAGSSAPDFVGLESEEEGSSDEEDLAEVERQLDAEAEAETDEDDAEVNPEEVPCVEDPEAAAEAFLAEMQAQGLLGPAVPRG